MQALMHEGGLTKDSIGKRPMTFNVDGVFIFQGTRLGVIQQIFERFLPHSTRVHYMAHRTNLAIQTLSHLQMVNKIEGLIQTLYNYFFKSQKRHLEFTKIVKLMEMEGAKILKNVKIHRISMFSLT
jgi:hypothetical protein